MYINSDEWKGCEREKMFLILKMTLDGPKDDFEEFEWNFIRHLMLPAECRRLNNSKNLTRLRTIPCISGNFPSVPQLGQNELLKAENKILR